MDLFTRSIYERIIDKISSGSPSSISSITLEELKQTSRFLFSPTREHCTKTRYRTQNVSCNISPRISINFDLYSTTYQPTSPQFHSGSKLHSSRIVRTSRASMACLCPTVYTVYGWTKILSKTRVPVAVVVVVVVVRSEVVEILSAWRDLKRVPHPGCGITRLVSRGDVPQGV